MTTTRLVILGLVLLFASGAHAWESHQEDTDENGDPIFHSEHLSLTAAAMDAVNAFEFLGPDAGPAAEQYGEVRDFNSAALGWDGVRTRTYYPARFSELPDYFYSMEDYIIQGRRCPPEAIWNAEQCHSFSHFMGSLNSCHFSPQTRVNYQKYHEIARAVLALGNDMHGELLLADALDEYGSHFEECRLEALTYEAIGQHYLQDQWAMGHMWNRWGGPDLGDFPPSGPFAIFADFPLGQLVYGQVIGAVSGMIHGWKSTVATILPEIMHDDALSYPAEGVLWVRSDLGDPLPGVGDLFLEGNWTSPQFEVQRVEAEACFQEGLRQVIGFAPIDTEISDLCWENYATNQAMNVGLNMSPSKAASLAVTAAIVAPSTESELINEAIDGAALEMLWLTTVYQAGGIWDPTNTYLAEGYTSGARTERLNLFSIAPNDAYADEPPSYLDPARTAPGDPVGGSTVLPAEDLFGARQVRFFNKCHAQHFCDNPSILSAHRDRCRAVDDGSREADCEICEDLAARFFVGDPPLCEILSPGRSPDLGGEQPPDSADAVRAWCRPADPSDTCDHPVAGDWAGVMTVIQGTDTVPFGDRTTVGCGDLRITVGASAGGDCQNEDFNVDTVCFIGMSLGEDSFRGCADRDGWLPPWNESFLSGTNDVMAEYQVFGTLAEFSVTDRLSVIIKEADAMGDTVVSSGLLGRCDSAVAGSCWEGGGGVCTEFGAGSSEDWMFCTSVIGGTWFPTPCPTPDVIGRCVRGTDVTNTTIYYTPIGTVDPASVCSDGTWETP